MPDHNSGAEEGFWHRFDYEPLGILAIISATVYGTFALLGYEHAVIIALVFIAWGSNRGDYSASSN